MMDSLILLYVYGTAVEELIRCVEAKSSPQSKRQVNLSRIPPHIASMQTVTHHRGGINLEWRFQRQVHRVKSKAAARRVGHGKRDAKQGSTKAPFSNTLLIVMVTSASCVFLCLLLFCCAIFMHKRWTSRPPPGLRVGLRKYSVISVLAGSSESVASMRYPFRNFRHVKTVADNYYPRKSEEYDEKYSRPKNAPNSTSMWPIQETATPALQEDITQQHTEPVTEENVTDRPADGVTKDNTEHWDTGSVAVVNEENQANNASMYTERKIHLDTGGDNVDRTPEAVALEQLPVDPQDRKTPSLQPSEPQQQETEMQTSTRHLSKEARTSPTFQLGASSPTTKAETTKHTAEAHQQPFEVVARIKMKTRPGLNLTKNLTKNFQDLQAQGVEHRILRKTKNKHKGKSKHMTANPITQEDTDLAIPHQQPQPQKQQHPQQIAAEGELSHPSLEHVQQKTATGISQSSTLKEHAKHTSSKKRKHKKSIREPKSKSKHKMVLSNEKVIIPLSTKHANDIIHVQEGNEEASSAASKRIKQKLPSESKSKSKHKMSLSNEKVIIPLSTKHVNDIIHVQEGNEEASSAASKRIKQKLTSESKSKSKHKMSLSTEKVIIPLSTKHANDIIQVQKGNEEASSAASKKRKHKKSTSEPKSKSKHKMFLSNEKVIIPLSIKHANDIIHVQEGNEKGSSKANVIKLKPTNSDQLPSAHTHLITSTDTNNIQTISETKLSDNTEQIADTTVPVNSQINELAANESIYNLDSSQRNETRQRKTSR